MNHSSQQPRQQPKRRKRKAKQGGVGGHSPRENKMEYPSSKSPRLLSPLPTLTKLTQSALHYAKHIRSTMLPLGHQALQIDLLHSFLEAEQDTKRAIDLLEAHVNHDHRKEAVAELEARLVIINEAITELMKEMA